MFHRASIVILAAAAFAGCASTTSSDTTASANGMQHGQGMHAMHDGGKDSCPMMMPGVTVTEQDTADGAALVFATTGDVAALRTHAGAMATKHNTMHTSSSAMMPASTARAEDIEGGVQLVITPAAAADVDAVRAQVRKHAEMAKNGECPMMHTPAA